MSPNRIKFRLAPGIRQSSQRAIGFLEGDGQLDAFEAIAQFGENGQRQLLTFMQSWVDGANKPATRFHGWPNDEDYKANFVFKVKENRLGHRLYGFLLHPQPSTNGRFQVCVLCIHAIKKERETDRSELERVKQWQQSIAGRAEIMAAFPAQLKNEPRGKLKQ